MPHDDTSVIPEPPVLEGIGGWLALAAYGVTLAPLAWLAEGGSLRLLLFQARERAAIKNPSIADLIDPLGLSIGFGGAAASIFVAVMFWRKSKKTPVLVIAQIVGGVISSVVASIACSKAFYVQLDVFTFAIQIVISGLWIGYFLRSKRVANTFIKA